MTSQAIRDPLADHLITPTVPELAELARAPKPHGDLSNDYWMCSLIAVLLSCAFSGV